jgi:hypothetical protein
MGSPVLEAETEKQTDLKRQTQAEILLDIANIKGIHLFKTPDGDAYVRLPVNGHWETYRLSDSAVKDWLIHQYRKQENGVPNKTAMEQTIAALAAEARFNSPTQEVHVRLAWQDDALYLDLHNDRHEVVRITDEGWDVVADAPVLFRHPPAMLPLPTPLRGGSLDRLKPFLNLPNDDNDRNWMLVAAWLIGAMHPSGPYPLLALHGEKGSAKTTTARYLRAILDPASADAPAQPRDAENLTLTAHHNWIVSFDNMSSMPRWLSDGLCRLATGAGSSTRKLYDNSEVVTFKAKRPCIINGIEELATAGDLLDRSIIVTLPVIDKKKRQSEAAINKAFERERPYILGGLLDAVVMALTNRDYIILEEKPRLADFAEWVIAAEDALGWKQGAFMEAYSTNQENATRLEIDASPVASAVIRLMQNRAQWKGTATDLLKELAQQTSEDDRHSFSWPKNGQKLAGTLRRVAGALREEGIEWEKQEGGTRHYTLRNAKLSAPSTAPKSTAPRPDIHVVSEDDLVYDEDGVAWAF